MAAGRHMSIEQILYATPIVKGLRYQRPDGRWAWTNGDGSKKTADTVARILGDDYTAGHVASLLRRLKMTNPRDPDPEELIPEGETEDTTEEAVADLDKRLAETMITLNVVRERVRLLEDRVTQAENYGKWLNRHFPGWIATLGSPL